MRPEEIEVDKDYEIRGLPDWAGPSWLIMNGDFVTAESLAGAKERFSCKLCGSQESVAVYYWRSGTHSYSCPCVMFPITDPDAETEQEESCETTT